jgi:hypothetical protein
MCIPPGKILGTPLVTVFKSGKGRFIGLVVYRCFEKRGPTQYRILPGLGDRVIVFISSVADPGCLSWIPLPESERYRIPDPDPQQKM